MAGVLDRSEGVDRHGLDADGCGEPQPRSSARAGRRCGSVKLAAASPSRPLRCCWHQHGGQHRYREHLRDAHACPADGRTLSSAYGSRLVRRLGATHAPLVERMLDHRHDSPPAAMAGSFDALNAAYNAVPKEDAHPGNVTLVRTQVKVQLWKTSRGQVGDDSDVPGVGWPHSAPTR